MNIQTHMTPLTFTPDELAVTLLQRRMNVTEQEALHQQNIDSPNWHHERRIADTIYPHLTDPTFNPERGALLALQTNPNMTLENSIWHQNNHTSEYEERKQDINFILDYASP